MRVLRTGLVGAGRLQGGQEGRDCQVGGRKASQGGPLLETGEGGLGEDGATSGSRLLQGVLVLLDELVEHRG